MLFRFNLIMWLQAAILLVAGPQLIRLVVPDPRQSFRDVCDLLFTEPLQLLYLNGPTLYNVGFWNGKSNAAICSEMTGQNVDQFFWDTHPEDCQDMIDRRFQTFALNVQLILYAYTVLNVFLALVSLLKYVLSDLAVIVLRPKSPSAICSSCR